MQSLLKGAVRSCSGRRVVGAGLILCTLQLWGQVPDQSSNLQVLPKDLGKRELLAAI